MLQAVKEQAIGLAVNAGALVFWAFIGVSISAPVWMPFVFLALLRGAGGLRHLGHAYTAICPIRALSRVA